MKTIQKQIMMAGVVALLAASLPVSSASAPGAPSQDQSIAQIQSSALLPVSSPAGPERVADRIFVVLTAYSSTPDQTDDTPFITASGTYVRDGIVATNLFPFGTKIKIPSLYGDKTFVVEDRMNPKKDLQVDIWFQSRELARTFGAKIAEIVILGG